MFWQMPCMLSNIDSVLDKSDLQLAEVLDDESVIQECKSLNTKLLGYLSSDATMDQMIDIIVSEPDCALSDKIRYRHPNVCCELLTCDIDSLNTALVDTDRHLHKLCAYLQSEDSLNPLTASFVSKILQLLARRKSRRLFAYLEPRPEFVGNLVRHTATAAVMDLLLAVVTMRDEDEDSSVDSPTPGNRLSAKTGAWLIKSGLVDRLLETLSSGDSIGSAASSLEDRRYNSAECICSILVHCREQAAQMAQESSSNPPDNAPSSSGSSSGHLLLDLLESRQTADRLLAAILQSPTPDESLIVAGLQVLLALLDDSDIVGDDVGVGIGGADSELLPASELDSDRMGFGSSLEAFGGSSKPQRLQQQRRLKPDHLARVSRSVVAALISDSRLGRIVGLLDSPPACRRWPTMPHTAGPPLEPPFGRPRLLVGRLLRRLLQLLLPSATDLAALSTSDSSVLGSELSNELTECLVASSALPRLFSLAMAYPWCSFLHLVAERCCSTVIVSAASTTSPDVSQPQLRLARQLLVDYRLAERLIKACRDDAKQAPSPGYRGHAIRLANYLNSCYCLTNWPDQLGQDDDSVKELGKAWRDFTDGDLAEINRLATASASANNSTVIAAGALAPPPSFAIPISTSTTAEAYYSASLGASKNDDDNDDEIDQIDRDDVDSDNDDEEEEDGIGPDVIVSGAARRKQQLQQQQQQMEASEEPAGAFGSDWADFSAFSSAPAVATSDEQVVEEPDAGKAEGWADFSQMN